MSIDERRSVTCCFTGYRLQKLPCDFAEQRAECKRVTAWLSESIEEAISRGYRHFIADCAFGVDTWAMEAVLAARERWPQVTLEAAITCTDQPGRWSAADYKRYFALLARCDIQTVLCKKYTDDSMMRCNLYMTSCSSLMIGVWSSQHSGTAQALDCANAHGLEVLLLRV